MVGMGGPLDVDLCSDRFSTTVPAVLPIERRIIILSPMATHKRTDDDSMQRLASCSIPCSYSESVCRNLPFRRKNLCPNRRTLSPNQYVFLAESSKTVSQVCMFFFLTVQRSYLSNRMSFYESPNPNRNPYVHRLS